VLSSECKPRRGAEEVEDLPLLWGEFGLEDLYQLTVTHGVARGG
jgi:hypothetical protein